MEQDILLFAKRFASEGFYVFPLYGSNKGPQKPYGWARNDVKKDVDSKKIIPATTDLAIIDQWPTILKDAYNAELVAYGILGLNIVIFDLDNKDGKDGSAKFIELRKRFNLPVAKLVCKSKSGGYHLFYAKPDKLKNVGIKTTANVVIGGVKYEGVDVRGDGGMVIGPTSAGPEEDWLPGVYQIVSGQPGINLSQLPNEVINALVKSGYSNNDIDALVSMYDAAEEDELSILKRGEVPPKLSKGNRNNGIYLYLNALKNKSFGPETAKKYVQNLIDVTEGKEDLHESVDIDDMIARIWQVNLNSPYDICRNIIDLGLYRLTSYKSKLMYVILNDNPYIDSKSAHDLASVKQLMAKFARKVTTAEGKTKVINPAELIDANITPDREVATMGFKPGASEIFTLTEADGGKKYLNVWRDPLHALNPHEVDPSIWEDFKFLVSRIFGPPGSQEYQLGLDLPAWQLQNPGIKPVVVPFLMSRVRGVGKSLYFKIMENIFGYSKMGDLQARPYKVEDISGRFFNPSGASLLMFDEVQFSVHRDMRKDSSAFWKHLKTLVTADTVPVEFKGGDVVIMPNLAGIMMAANTNNNFPIEEFDRRIWVINNDPPEMEHGVLDRFYMMSKTMMTKEEKRVVINSLLYYLSRHKIQLPLDRMRAPMNELKKEMMMSTLNDLEEWWITHFDEHSNLLAESALLTKSAIMYVIFTAERLANTRWRDDIEGTFRELKRRGLIQPIRTKNDNYQTRQFRNLPQLKLDGTIIDSHRESRDVLYTTRQHGEFNNQDNEPLVQSYIRNLNSIVRWRKSKLEASSSRIADSLNK